MKHISVIIPFYEGSKYISNLINQLERINSLTDFPILEVNIINDSPWYGLCISNKEDFSFNINIIKNKHNMGIQKSRINGLLRSNGEYILFLDQDDELCIDGFELISKYMPEYDILFGNTEYQFINIYRKIYSSKLEMLYLFRYKIFLTIRNVIPSPGCCLIKRTSIPDAWINNPLINNGSDDWMLWLLLFRNKPKFFITDKISYRHKTSDSGNLSADIGKMYLSSKEMSNKLVDVLSNYESNTLLKAIEFKYKQDTCGLNINLIIGYFSIFIRNIIYKIIRYLI